MHWRSLEEGPLARLVEGDWLRLAFWVRKSPLVLSRVHLRSLQNMQMQRCWLDLWGDVRAKDSAVKACGIEFGDQDLKGKQLTKRLAGETWLMGRTVSVQNALMNNSCAEVIGSCLNLFYVSLSFTKRNFRSIALTRIGICIKMLRIDRVVRDLLRLIHRLLSPIGLRARLPCLIMRVI
jgi:hypothetical protein